MKVDGKSENSPKPIELSFNYEIFFFGRSDFWVIRDEAVRSFKVSTRSTLLFIMEICLDIYLFVYLSIFLLPWRFQRKIAAINYHWLKSTIFLALISCFESPCILFSLFLSIYRYIDRFLYSDRKVNQVLITWVQPGDGLCVCVCVCVFCLKSYYNIKNTASQPFINKNPFLSLYLFSSLDNFIY